MLVCYLDDSGKHPESPVTTLAGYVATEDGWAAFEKAAEPIFREYVGDTPLHAMRLFKTEDIYADWTLLKKHSFVAQICRELAKIRPFAVSMSVKKQSYSQRALAALLNKVRKQTITPYTFAFQAILNWLMTDVRCGREVHAEGLAFMIEAGNEHNGEAERAFHYIREHFGLENILKSISFVPKTHSRAIQMADLFAYFTRRHSGAIVDLSNEERAKYQSEMFLKIIIEGIQLRSFVATDFDQPASQRLFQMPSQNPLDRS